MQRFLLPLFVLASTSFAQTTDVVFEAYADPTSSSSVIALATSTFTPSTQAMYTPGPVYVYETVSDCTTDDLLPTLTVTNAKTITYCPACAHHTTVYETVYSALCTDGPVWSMTPSTYIVTETCDGEAKPTWSAGQSGYIPQGYVVSTMHCGACATPGPVTFTAPCGCRATNGVMIVGGDDDDDTYPAPTANVNGGSPLNRIGGSPKVTGQGNNSSTMWGNNTASPSSSVLYSNGAQRGGISFGVGICSFLVVASGGLAFFL